MIKDSTTLDTAWVKSSYSAAQSDCVEYGVLPDRIAVRDSKNPGGPALTVPDPGWGAFVAAVAEGRI